jgi:hypothetical protein
VTAEQDTRLGTQHGAQLECRLRLAPFHPISSSPRAERDCSSKPLQEHHGPNPMHDSEAANSAELEKLLLSGACCACLDGRVQHDLSHLDFLQHGRSATHRQRTDKAFCVPCNISSKHF